MSYEATESGILVPEKVKILHVDDTEVHSILVRNFLGKLRFTVKSFNHPHKILNELDKNPDWQLLITDGQMPDMNGQELVQTIRTTNQTIATLLLSGKPDLFDVRVFDAYEKKPFTRLSLPQAVTRAYNHRHDILSRYSTS